MRCDAILALVNNERRIQALVSGRRMDEAGWALRNGLATKRYAMQVTGTAALQSEAPPAIPPLLIAT